MAVVAVILVVTSAIFLGAGLLLWSINDQPAQEPSVDRTELEPKYPVSSADTGQRSRPSTLAKREVA